jgi:alkanesulfonate monooxygenase SsuD/methylene tetrahydromethanopterin reductase-like flavin-dependent oxidoreductase (luciferase family)
VYNAFLAWCGFEVEAKRIAVAFAGKDRAGVAAAITDEIVDRIAIIGTPDECREQIAGFVAAGVTTPVLAPLAMSREEAVRMLEVFAPGR